MTVVLCCLVKLLFKISPVEQGLGVEHDHSDDQLMEIYRQPGPGSVASLTLDCIQEREKTSANSHILVLWQGQRAAAFF